MPEGDFIPKKCCGAIFGHQSLCANYRPPDTDRMYVGIDRGRPYISRDEIVKFLLSLEQTCKTTLDWGIKVKDYVTKNKDKLI